MYDGLDLLNVLSFSLLTGKSSLSHGAQAQTRITNLFGLLQIFGSRYALMLFWGGGKP